MIGRCLVTIEDCTLEVQNFKIVATIAFSAITYEYFAQMESNLFNGS
jgi:hypothetical protein